MPREKVPYLEFLILPRCITLRETLESDIKFGCGFGLIRERFNPASHESAMPKSGYSAVVFGVRFILHCCEQAYLWGQSSN